MNREELPEGWDWLTIKEVAVLESISERSVTERVKAEKYRSYLTEEGRRMIAFDVRGREEKLMASATPSDGVTLLLERVLKVSTEAMEAKNAELEARRELLEERGRLQEAKLEVKRHNHEIEARNSTIQRLKATEEEVRDLRKERDQLRKELEAEKKRFRWPFGRGRI